MSERSLEQVYRQLPWYRRHEVMFGVTLAGMILTPLLLIVGIAAATGPIYRHPGPGGDRLEPWHPAARYLLFGVLAVWLLIFSAGLVELMLANTSQPSAPTAAPSPAPEPKPIAEAEPQPRDRTLELQATVNGQPANKPTRTAGASPPAPANEQAKTAADSIGSEAPQPMAPGELHRFASPAVALVMVMTHDRQFQVGTGFFINPDGILVTNHHVVENAAAATVILKDETRCKVRRILASSRQSDLAILEVEAPAAVEFLPLAEAPMPETR